MAPRRPPTWRRTQPVGSGPTSTADPWVLQIFTAWCERHSITNRIHSHPEPLPGERGKQHLRLGTVWGGAYTASQLGPRTHGGRGFKDHCARAHKCMLSGTDQYTIRLTANSSRTGQRSTCRRGIVRRLGAASRWQSVNSRTVNSISFSFAAC